MSEDPTAAKRSALRRMKTINGLLILCMAAAMAAVRLYFPATPWSPWVLAFAEAALVGGLADWFAVTALFRRPLGLPIPHTAIIPRNQARIGDGIGNFIANNFLAPEAVGARVAQLDVGRTAAEWLAVPQNRARLSGRLAAALPVIAGPLDGARLGRWLGGALGRRLETGLGPTLAAEVLSLLVAAGVHERLLDKLIELFQEFVSDNRAQIERRIDAQLPRWLPKAVDRAIFGKVLAVLDDALVEIAQPDSGLRQRIADALKELAVRLREDPALRLRVGAQAARLMDHPRTQEALAELIDGVKAQLLEPDADGAPKIAAGLDRLLATYGRSLEQDREVRAQFQAMFEAATERAILRHRRTIGDWISGIVKRWDTATTTEKIETQIGGDLQYIRLNGALVGGLIGLCLKGIEFALA